MDKLTCNEINTDGVCVYISSGVTNPMAGKVALLLADLLIFAVGMVAVQLWIPGLLLLSLLIFLMLTKYTLWNFFGIENLIINTKTISYQHHYGFFKTGYVSKSFKGDLLVNAIPVVKEKDKKRDAPQLLRLSFVSHRQLDLLPYEVYAPSFYFLEEEVLQLDEYIQRLYADNLPRPYHFPMIYLN